MQVKQSDKLANVCYEIRGPVLKRAKQLEDSGHRILKLNIGNPAPFGFEAPPEILQDVIFNLAQAHGYSDSKGLLSARRAIVQHYEEQGIAGLDVEDIYLGNGVSELIVMTLQAMGFDLGSIETAIGLEEALDALGVRVTQESTQGRYENEGA